MAIITLRIPENLRRQIRRLKHVNWSQIAREAIEERVAMEKTREGKDRAEIVEASRSIDELFEELRGRYGRLRYDSSRTIRTWRDARYSSSSPTPR